MKLLICIMQPILIFQNKESSLKIVISRKYDQIPTSNVECL
jgi:hypothetical protein